MSREIPAFVAHLNVSELAQVTVEAQPLLVEWWNVSRRQRHGSSAVWTENAWRLSVVRVSKLPAWQQVALAEAGVEHGWQALKPDYIRDAAPPLPSAALAPKSAAMRDAVSAWTGRC